MNSLKNILFCGSADIKKWRVEPRVLIIALTILILALNNYVNLDKIAIYYKQKLPVWSAISFFSYGTMELMFGLLTGLLFCSAPFYEEHSPFLVVRTGRVNWILGQFFYIISASFLFAACVFVASWLAILPAIGFSNGWGTVIRTLSNNPSALQSFGARTYFIAGIERFNPITANLLSFLMIWLTAVFVGMLFTFFGTVCGRVTAFSVYGVLLFLTLSSKTFGFMIYGYIIRYIAPISFCNVFIFREFSNDPHYPTLGYGIAFLVLSIVIMGIAVVFAFCKKDLIVEKEI